GCSRRSRQAAGHAGTRQAGRLRRLLRNARPTASRVSPSNDTSRLQRAWHDSGKGCRGDTLARGARASRCASLTGKTVIQGAGEGNLPRWVLREKVSLSAYQNGARFVRGRGGRNSPWLGQGAGTPIVEGLGVRKPQGRCPEAARLRAGIPRGCIPPWRIQKAA